MPGDGPIDLTCNAGEAARQVEAAQVASSRHGDATIYLARHGRTELNAAGKLRGNLDVPLDEIGESEAGALAVALASAAPLLVVSSPLRRALETAQAIASNCGSELESDTRLRDRDYGCWSGSLVAEVIARWGSVDDAPGVEPFDHVVERAYHALEQIADRVTPHCAVVVSHDAVNRALLSVLSPTKWRSPGEIPQPTGCLNVLRREGRDWVIGAAGVLPGTADRPSRW